MFRNDDDDDLLRDIVFLPDREAFVTFVEEKSHTWNIKRKRVFKVDVEASKSRPSGDGSKRTAKCMFLFFFMFLLF